MVVALDSASSLGVNTICCISGFSGQDTPAGTGTNPLLLLAFGSAQAALPLRYPGMAGIGNSSWVTGFSPPSLEAPVYGSQASESYRPIHEILEPLLLSQPFATQPQSEGVQNALYCTLTLIWLTGFIFFTARWWGRNLRLVRTIRAGRRIGSGRETRALKRVRSWLLLNREVEVVVSSQFTEAGLWGIRKPVILLPEGATSQLSDDELAAVLMHELVHLERRDNLVVFLQRALTCLLWFYPLTWLIDRKLVEERERACDEEVLRLRQSPETYVSGILKVVRACLEWTHGRSCVHRRFEPQETHKRYPVRCAAQEALFARVRPNGGTGDSASLVFHRLRFGKSRCLRHQENTAGF